MCFMSTHPREILSPEIMVPFENSYQGHARTVKNTNLLGGEPMFGRTYGESNGVVGPGNSCREIKYYLEQSSSSAQWCNLSNR